MQLQNQAEGTERDILEESLDDNFHDATPTWSGFNYQGKVALYTLLKLINSSDFDGACEWSLELEWLEDFSIKCNGNYCSIHQVKAYNTCNLNKYSEAIFKLTKKVIDYDIDVAYLHTWKGIEGWEHERVRNYIKSEIDKYKDSIDNISLILNDTEKFEKSINKIRKNSKKLNKKEEVIRDLILENGIDINSSDTSICESLGQIISDKVENHIDVYVSCVEDSDSFLELFSKIKTESCSIDEIETKLKDEIKIYCRLKGIDYQSTDLCYLYFLGYIDKHIHKRHLFGQVFSIAFKNLVDILNSDDLRDTGEEYLAYELKNLFSDIFARHCLDCQPYGEEADNKCEACRVKTDVELINEFYSNNFAEFCRIISPNIHAEPLNMRNYHKLLPPVGVRASFFEIIDKMEQKTKKHMNRFIFEADKNGEKQTILPSTIHLQSNKEGEKWTIARDIINTPSNSVLEALFEVNTIVSKDIDIVSLKDASNMVGSVPEQFRQEGGENSKYNDRITKMGDISIISVNKGIEELK